MSRPDNDRSIGELIKLAGVRDRPSDEAMERARAAARASWQRGLATPTRRGPLRWMTLGTLAAAASVAAFVWWQRAPESAPRVPAEVARIVKAGASLEGTLLAEGAPVFDGATLVTGADRAALRLGDALSLRLDAGTRLVLEAPDRVRLIAGAVYVDSGGLTSARALAIHTPAGVVRHVGTQFQVRVAGDEVRVQVREGRVLVAPVQAGAAEIGLGVGDELQAQSGAPAVIRHNQASFGAQWQWAASVAPSFDIENRPLAEFAAWLAREQGWQLRYATPAKQQQALDIRLHGTVDGLEPEAMLRRIAMITGVPLAARDGVLEVGGEQQ
jgi:ferric-dicitrate binding protein FerR (iron transport regulator)